MVVVFGDVGNGGVSFAVDWRLRVDFDHVSDIRLL